MEGGLGTPASSAGSSTCKRLQQPRRPGYLRTELPRLQGTLAGEEGRTAWLTYGASGCHGMNKQNGHSDVIKMSLRLPVPPGSCVSVSQQLSPLETYSSEAYKPSLSYQNNHLISSSPTPPLLFSSPPPLSQEEGCCVTKCSSPSPQASSPSPQASSPGPQASSPGPQSDFRLTPGSIPLQPCLLSPNPRPRSPNPRSPNPRSPNPRTRSSNPNSRTCPSGSTGSRSPQSPQPTCPSRSPPSGDTPFSSSFSFIQQSLSLYSLGSSHSTDTDPGLNPDPQPLNSSPGLNPDPQPLNSPTGLNPNPLDQSSARSLRTGSVPSHSEPLERSGSVPPCQSRPVSASLDQLPSRTSGSSSNQSGLGVLGLSLGLSVSKLSTPSRVQSEPGSVPLSQSDRGRDRLSPWVWQDRHWEAREGAGPSLGAELPSSVTSDLAELEPDCDSSSLDTEAVSSSLSVGEDSDAASASSLTSGYESATPTTATPGPAHNCTPGPAHDCTPDQDRGWDQVVKKYEGVLQDCLHNNRTNTKIQSMMLKLQRLQQKAILEDEYDSDSVHDAEATETTAEGYPGG
ncbi:hypothetical protein J4Q44_G00274270 [Coregonus suidteri]|uniref:Uncharacterized protein n=1 Tax=Coregonus suidteri TaxID=861788 RepID=A0AAN8KUK7_9TELE